MGNVDDIIRLIFLKKSLFAMAKKKTKNTGQKLSLRKQKPLSSEQANKLQLAYSLHQKGDLNQAKNLYQQILADRPSHAETNFLFGLLVSHAGLHEQGEALLSKAVQVSPIEPRYLVGLGILLLQTSQFDKAVIVLQKAVKVAPKQLEAIQNLGTAYFKQKSILKAVECFESALKLKPDHLPSLNNMGNAQLALCNIEQANEFYLRAHEQDTTSLGLLSDILLNSNYMESLSAEALSQKHILAADHFPKKKQTIEYKAKPNNKIRIGYVSADFRIHSVASFLIPLISNHNREKFEIYCFYNGEKVDRVTHKFESLADHWEMIHSLSDEAVAQLISKNEIDILVDLSGHTSHNRLSVFSRRAAPIQISWLGYPHSTGIPEMDIRIIDEITDPTLSSDKLSSEKLIRLPKGFLCFEGDTSIPYQKEPPSIKNGYITFGSFNNLAKVTDSVIKTWAEILLAVPNSRMIIKSRQMEEKSLRERYLGYFQSVGITPDRITLLEVIQSLENHLQVYDQIDIALDTFPYNGTTTTCEAMWMGVPTMTFTGDRHAARVGASIMTHAGFIELVSDDLSSFKTYSIDLANNAEKLIELRADMRERMQQSDICNAKQFTKHMEEAFQSSLGPITNQASI